MGVHWIVRVLGGACVVALSFWITSRYLDRHEVPATTAKVASPQAPEKKAPAQVPAQKVTAVQGLKPGPVAADSRCQGNPITLQKPFHPGSGFAYVVNTPSLASTGDTLEFPERSKLVLCENGKPLGPGHSAHQDIRQLGQGRFSHWGGAILFSASDNSDPNSNNRVYTATNGGG